MKLKTFSLSPLYLAMGLALPAMAQDNSESPSTSDLEEVYIVGVRENRNSSGATGLSLSLKDTPQSISVIDRELMDSFGASDINAALDLATGVRVERWETNRTNYVSRGFAIQHTQVDGVGMPNDWGIVTGAMDAYGYEKIEVIRGANGLLTGIGNASGTVNYVRKRPTNDASGEIGVSAGSWDRKRLEADYSTPLSPSGNWAGRVVVAAEDADSHVRGMENERSYFYGVVDGELTENSALAIGASYQDASTTGNMWGGLIFANSDGTQAEWDTDASTSQDWTYWDTYNKTAFAEYSHRLPSDWELKAGYEFRGFEAKDKLFYVYSATGLDPETGEGLIPWPGSYADKNTAHLWSASLAGGYELFGEEQQANFGVTHSYGTARMFNAPVLEAGSTLPGFPYGGDVFEEPVWGDWAPYSSTDQTVTRAYASTQIKMGALSVIPGFNYTDYEREQSGVRGNVKQDEVSPYLGVTFAFSDNVSAYVSYSDVYQPQDQYDIDGIYLEPTKGVNFEFGAKAEWLDGALLTNFAVFEAEQQGLATYAGMHPETQQYYYEGQDVTSRGYELEITGALTDNISLLLGYTSLQELEDEAGTDSYGWVPEETVNFAVNATLPQLPVSLGLGGNWQSETSKVDANSGLTVTQDSYLLLNAFAKWDIDERSQLQLNVNNLADEKYIASLYEIGYYGAPRNATISYQYSF